MNQRYRALWALLRIVGIAHVACLNANESEIKKLSLPLSGDLVRADVFSVTTTAAPSAVLVLCPGQNGNGDRLLTQEWRAFAKSNHLGLVGISFASDVSQLDGGGGYYRAAAGSGELLLQAIKKIFGKDLPLLMYGFSGGAHFILRFEEWHPDKVKAWCAYSPPWWDSADDRPRSILNSPPGIIACGEEDTYNYGTSLSYFKQGRAAGRKWLWVSLAGTGHRWSRSLDGFVRLYFKATLEKRSVSHSPDARQEWKDIDTKAIISSEDAESCPSIAGWLPDHRIGNAWDRIHSP